MGHARGTGVRAPFGDEHQWSEERREYSGAVRADIDAHTIATMCFGAYFVAFYRGEDSKQLTEQVVAMLWPGIAAGNCEPTI